jgi:hypothetical protein
MIDAPANYTGMLQQSTSMSIMDRGYDFTGVVRWFADRADIVCLFFDPGTCSKQAMLEFCFAMTFFRILKFYLSIPRQTWNYRGNAFDSFTCIEWHGP